MHNDKAFLGRETRTFTYLHPLDGGSETLPAAFTFPFRYTPHPLCVKAAAEVRERLKELGVTEGKMYGVLVGRLQEDLFFLAAYSGQLFGSYAHPWFVPPVVDYLDPESFFQREQAEIMSMGTQLEAMRESEQRRAWQRHLQDLKDEQRAVVAKAKRAYEEGREKRKEKREKIRGNTDNDVSDLIRESQQQKADIQRAKHLHQQEIADLEAQLAAFNSSIHQLFDERKHRSEALQQWLFEQFNFSNARGEYKNLIDIFSPSPHLPSDSVRIPSGAGECCAPKLLQTAYRLGLEPLAMAEFWWGSSKPGHYRQPGAFFPACHSKCRPILGHMLQGLHVEPDPAEHYNRVHASPRVLWEDASIAVIVKPEGWVSIPGKCDQPCLLDEAERLWPDITGPVIVHRLDMDTSGVMLIAKNAQAHHALSTQFERREVHKRYVALLEGEVKAAKGEICLPLGPDLDNLPRQQVDIETGKEAVTRYEVLGQETRSVGCRAAAVSVTRIAFYPETGRTHQLRVHSASPDGLNAPILGDRLYGKVADRLYLHAEAITFTHPVSKERMHFEEPAAF